MQVIWALQASQGSRLAPALPPSPSYLLPLGRERPCWMGRDRPESEGFPSVAWQSCWCWGTPVWLHPPTTSGRCTSWAPPLLEKTMTISIIYLKAEDFLHLWRDWNKHYLRKSNQRFHLSHAAPDRWWWGAEVDCWSSACSRYLHQTRRPGMSSRQRRCQYVIRVSRLQSRLSARPHKRANESPASRFTQERPGVSFINQFLCFTTVRNIEIDEKEDGF